MIVFSGIVSDDIQSKTLQKRHKYVFFVCTIGSVALIVVSGIIWYVFWIETIKEWLLWSAILIGVLILTELWPLRKKPPFRWEYHITIDEEKISVETPLWTKPLQKPMKKIKRVLDDGDCYYIIYGDINNSIVCEKNLLKEGTIEEFEKLFEGKLVRKKSKT